MKIAEVVSTFPPYHGGMGYVCLYNTAELMRRGHDVTVFTVDYRRGQERQLPSGPRTLRLRSPFTYGDAAVVPQLYSQLKGYDIVHLHYPFFGGAEYVYLSSLLRKQKYFLTYHLDVYGDSFLKHSLITAYEKLLMTKIVRGASMVGALNLEHFQSSKVAGLVDPTKVIEMPNGVDTKKFCPEGKDPKLVAEYGLEGKTVVLFVGNLQPFKGLHVLIDAIGEIRDESVVLLVVGGGYGEKKYREQVTQKKLGKRVFFAGPKSPDKDLCDHFNLGDFLVLPSTHSESYGLVILEAMASGKPVIASSLPGPSKLVNDGTDGLLVNPGDVADLKDKIERLAYEEGLRSSMARAALEKAKGQYSWAAVGTRLEKVLISIADDEVKT